MGNRRIFLQKMSLLAGISLTGIGKCPGDIESKEIFKGLILRSDEGEIRYIGNTRKAKVFIKISKTSEYTPEMSLLSELITPGDGIPVHKHLNEEEFLFIQKGKVEITLGDNVEKGRPGDLIYVPKETWHGFLNIGEEEVVLFFGYSPSGFEDYFRAIGTTDIDEDLDFTVEDWNRINKEYGVIYRS